jgi:uncharacterized protein YkwD
MLFSFTSPRGEACDAKSGANEENVSEHRAPKRVRVGILGAVVLAGVVAVGGGISALQVAGGSEKVAHPDSVAVAITPTGPNLSFDTSSEGATPSLSPSAGPSSAAPPSASPPPPAPKPSKSTTAPKPKQTTRAAAPGTGSAEQQVLNVINQARADAGAGPLTMSSGLIASAHAHNLVMEDGCGLSHQCDGEDGLGDRISAQDVDWSSVAENIGDGGPVNDTEAAQAAMAVNLTNGMLAETPPDDGHRKNILNASLHHIGIDVIRDADGTVWLTQDFSN